LLGRARQNEGCLKDLIEGELEIGQIAGLIHEVKSAEEIILEIADYNMARKEIVALDF
jgi:enoyl-[acyl-carrier protein] reductase II